MAQQHPLDQIVDDLEAWIDSEVDALVGALTEGTGAPFAAHASKAEQLAYYHAAFFNPDGTPNLQGRAREMQRLGPDQYAQTMRTVLDERQKILDEAKTKHFGPDPKPGTVAAMPPGMPPVPIPPFQMRAA